MNVMRGIIPLALLAALGGCSIGSLLGGGGKPPVTLFTLSPNAPDQPQISRTANASQAVTITNPVIGKALRTTRVAVEVGPTQVQYVKNVQLVDMPDRLFQALLEETVRRTTNRVVLDSRQSTLDPGILVTGELQHFGYDSQTGQVVVQYDAAMSGAGGSVESRRFTARVPADGTAATVPGALNDAANQVATQVAQWIGG